MFHLHQKVIIPAWYRYDSLEAVSNLPEDVTEAEDTATIFGHMMWSYDTELITWQGLCDDTAGNWLWNQLETGLVCFTYFTPRTVADRLKIDKPETRKLVNEQREIDFLEVISGGFLCLFCLMVPWSYWWNAVNGAGFSCRASNHWKTKISCQLKHFLFTLLAESCPGR